jgi:polyphosphate glucokinase
LVGHDWLSDLQSLSDSPVALLNDADAAALAETQFGAGSQTGTVLLITLGTGIGSALVYNGVLFPNTEFGHLLMAVGRNPSVAAETVGRNPLAVSTPNETRDLTEAEDLAAASVKTRENLSWSEYGQRLNRFLLEMERLLSPNLIIIGGGISENFDRYAAGLDLNVEVVPAALGNNAGLIGAALAAASQS